MKNEHPAFFLSRDGYCKFIITGGGIAVIELRSFTTFLAVTDCVLALSQTKMVWMISSYGDRSLLRIILHIIIVLHQRCLNCSECFQRLYLVFYTYINIRVTHLEMVLLSIFFTRIRSTEGSSADCSLFILSLHALALHLAVKILAKSFCMKIWAR